jgi:GTP-binding protein
MKLLEDPLRIVAGDFIAAAAVPTSIPPPSEVEVAFVGRSNVGKSSLLNTLCARRSLFRTSSTPGCTRQLVFFSARTGDGSKVTLVDVPGYGYAARSKTERKQWAELIDAYLLGRSTLAAVAVLVDGRRGASDDERELVALLRSKSAVHRAPLGLLAVVTKLDKLPVHQRNSSVKALSLDLGAPALGFSCELPETHSPLWRKLRGSIGLAAS